MISVNILVGRFQPITLGHLKSCREAYNKTGLKTVLCVTPGDAKSPDKSPFPREMVLDYLHEFKNGSGRFYIEGIVEVDNAFLPTVLENVGVGYKVENWICGTDRVDTYMRQLARVEVYRKELGIEPPNINLLEVPRTSSSISGTEVRSYIERRFQRTWDGQDAYLKYVLRVPRELAGFWYIKLNEVMNEKHKGSVIRS